MALMPASDVRDYRSRLVVKARNHASFDAIFATTICCQWMTAMRTTIALDDKLIAKAQQLTGLQEKPALVREALRALIERESACRLARLGGSEPDLKPVPRRRQHAT